MKKKLTQSGKPHPGNAKDLYQQITDKVVAALENGTAPWKRPWRSVNNERGGIVPSNALTGNAYSGVNILLLWMSAEERGFSTNRWLTYRQAQQLGGQVRKREQATGAVIYKPLQVQAEDRDGNKLLADDGQPLMVERAMLKSLYLFNVLQCDNLPAHLQVSAERIPDQEVQTLSAQTYNRVLAILNASGVQVTSAAQNRAFYSPNHDRIVMPLSRQFFTEADYWATLLHEMVHSTGHASRLNREGITASSGKFGDPAYAFEELCAEMGSAFLCAHLEVLGEVNHESYIDHWLNVLKADKKALFRACRQAREASEYLLRLNSNDDNQRAA